MLTPDATRSNQASDTGVAAERMLIFGALAMLTASALAGGSVGTAVAGPSAAASRAHAQAGSVGWLTLALLAVAVHQAHTARGRPRGQQGSRREFLLSALTVAAVAAFVVAGATGFARAREWSGMAMLAAMAGLLAWLTAISRRARVTWTVPNLAMAAALAVLVSGIVIAVMSAGAAASDNWAGAATLGSAYSALLSVPFVVLAATCVVEWAATSPADPTRAPTTAGLLQVGAMLLAAAAMIAGLLTRDLALVEANIPLEFAAIAIFLARVGPAVLAAGWAVTSRIWLATAAIGLAADVGLFANVVIEIGRRRYVTANMIPRWLTFSIDHVTFVAVGTAAMFGAIAVIAGRHGGHEQPSLTGRRWLADLLPAAGSVVGLAGAAAGLAAGSAFWEGLFAAVLGISVLAGALVAGMRVATMGRQIRA